MQRRNFLRTAGALTIPTLPGFSAASSSLFTSLIYPDSDRVLVIVQMFGGNDGLNTLIPLDQYSNLYNVRRHIIVPERDALKLTDTIAMHPRMSGMKNLFGDGKLGIIQNVGYPNQNRSHFRSTDIWTSGSDADVIETSGWFGRYLDESFPGYPKGYPSAGQPHPPAISIGNVAHPTCEGMVTNFSQTVIDPDKVTVLAPGGYTPLPSDNYGDELSWIRATIDKTNSYGDVVQQASKAGRNLADYPSRNDLAGQLRKVARMIDGGLKTRVYTVNINGFDTHANQTNTSPIAGNHANLLQEVSEALTAFQEDLRRLGLEKRVLGMTFSEFGRRIKANASRGTDHGTAGPMFLFGSCVEGGVLGSNPIIDKDVSQSAGVPMEFDFRDVYGSILVDWFGVETSRVRNLLHQNFKYLPIAGQCNEGTSTSTANAEPNDGYHVGQPYPNPARGPVRVRIDAPGSSQMRYSLFDLRGRKVFGREITVSGSQDYLLFDRPGRLPAGGYLLRFTTREGVQRTRRVILD